MNKIFKVIWNPATGSYSVASETAKSRGKKSGRSKLLISALVAGGLLSSFGVNAEVALDGGKSAEEAAGDPSLTDNWIAIGQGAIAASNSGPSASIAIGKNSQSAVGATALGFQSLATGERSVSIGQVSTASGNRAIALGSGSKASGDYTIALGRDSKAEGLNSITFGQNALSQGAGSLAVGFTSQATEEKGLALGYKAISSGVKAIAMGAGSNAEGENSLALGDTASASKEYSMALGASSKADGVDSLALGRLSATSAANAIAMGAETEAAENATAIGFSADALGKSSLALGDTAEAAGTDSLALGRKSLASAANAIAMGAETEAAENATAIGFSADAKGKSSLALGDSAEAGEVNSIAIGQGSKASKDSSIALGSNSRSSGVNAIALGNSSNAGGINSLAFGLNANANGDNAVAIGANSTAGSDDTVSVGSASLQRKIVNMGKGDINNTSTDAINGSQLYDISKSVSDRLGGYHQDPTNVINSEGTLKAPTYYLQSGQYNNVGEALQGIDNNTLHWDGKKYSASHTAFNIDGSVKSSQAQSIITNVADGLINENSTDAVNGSQLNATNTLINQIAGNTSTTYVQSNGAGINYVRTNDTGLIFKDASASGSGATAVGYSANATGVSSLALGQDTQAKGKNSIAIGTKSVANVDETIVLGIANSAGLQNRALQQGGIAIGRANKSDGIDAIVLGNESSAAGNYSLSLGTASNAGIEDAIALGHNATVTGKSSVALGAGSEAKDADVVSVGNSTLKRKLINVKSGTISENSTDAINGSQIYDISYSVATHLGGGAGVEQTTGVVTSPNYVLKNGTASTVGQALAILNDNTVQWDALNGVYNAAHGSEATSKITNVKDGTVSAISKDAVNGSQLNTTNTNVTNLGNTVNGINTTVSGHTTSITALNADVDNLEKDALLWDSTASAFSASHSIKNPDGTTTTSDSKITNVAAGTLADDSTDAVNGSQLNIVKTDVTNLTTTVSGHTTSIQALENDALLWDSTTGAFSASHSIKNPDGSTTTSNSKITNVAAGTLADDSTDAVNGAQLYATNQQINKLMGDTSNTYITDNGAGVKYLRTNDTGLTASDAHASGIGATAVGYNAAASGIGSIAVGRDSSSTVEGGIALGSGSSSTRVIASGSLTTSVTSSSVTIGYDTTDRTLLGALSLGTDGQSYRQITNMADGSEAHDAVTVRQLQNSVAAVSITPTKYYHANSTEADSLAVGENAIAVGPKTVVNGDSGIGIGYGSTVAQTATSGVALGTGASANHAYSVALGSGAQTTVGAQSGYTAYNLDTAQNSVGEVSVGSDSGQRQITNVAAGSKDTDAVNVSQLKVTDIHVSQNTQNIAQNTKSINNLNIQVSSLDTRVTDIENSVGDIVTTGNTKYFKTSSTGSDANAQGEDSVAIGSSSVASAKNSVALGTGSVADEVDTVSVGSSTKQRRITNVAAGKNDTDAVNVAQLKSSQAGNVRYDTYADGSINYESISLGNGSGGTTRISNVSAAVNGNDAVNYTQLKQGIQETKSYTDQKMAQMSNKVSDVEKKVSGGVASAMAMTGLPQAYAPGASMASIGGGTYNGESAVALGVSMVSSSGTWVYKLQGSTNSQGEYSAAIGAGIQW